MKTFCLIAAIALLSACSACGQKLTTETAPATFKVNFDTSRGLVVIEVNRADAPVGADRFYNMVKAKVLDGARFFRVLPGFMAQFGIPADPAVGKIWNTPIEDDPVKTTNARGTLTFAATAEPNSRTTQMFINFADNGRLDSQRFAPIGKVIGGMEFVDQIYAGDTDRPLQPRIEAEGNTYLEKEFPKLDYIKTGRIAP
jgi:peptidyl-prolyl cis-trans isomerase A (cyclophilin A)